MNPFVEPKKEDFMAQLGSKKNPAEVHVKTQERAIEIIGLFISLKNQRLLAPCY